MANLILIASAGIVAGAMNALAGGGSFITLPVLIGAGLPSVIANATSTVALWPGAGLSAWVYRDGLCPIAGVPLRLMGRVTLLGGAVGGLLLLLTPSPLFDHALPWLLLVATLALAFGRGLGEMMRRRWRLPVVVAVAVQALLGIYGGYYGGGVGIMMIAVWSLLDAMDIKALHAPRTLLVCVANGAAVLAFTIAGAVAWPAALAMGAGGLVGGAGGSWAGRRLPAVWVRRSTLALCAIVTALFFFRTYG